MEGEVCWSENKWRFAGVRTSIQTGPADNPRRKDFEPKSPVESIVDGSEYIAYYPNGKVVRIELVSKVGPDPLMIRPPNEWWYGDGRRWIILLGPHPSLPQDSIKRYRAQRLDDNRVELIREDRSGARFRFVASLRDDGNIIEVRGTDPVSDIRELDETYTWSRDSKGRCYLAKSSKRLKCKSKTYGKLVDLCTQFECDFFDADYDPAPSTFSLKSLQLPPRTRVDDNVGNRHFRMGAAPVVSVVEQLDRLVTELKTRGFAESGRE